MPGKNGDFLPYSNEINTPLKNDGLLARATEIRKLPPWKKKKGPRYIRGDHIRCIEQFVTWGQLSSGGMFYWNGMLRSFAFLQNWQLRSLLEAIKGGYLYAAQKY
jgi:hypothetical protein